MRIVPRTAMAVLVLFLGSVLEIGGPTSRAWSAGFEQGVSTATQDHVRSCIGGAPRVRITGTFGCIEVGRPEVVQDGIWCEHVSPCEFNATMTDRMVLWSQIEKVEIGQPHAREGAGIGYVIALGAAAAVVWSRSDKSGFNLLLLPLAVGIVALPFVIAGEGIGSLVGHGMVSWQTCYVGLPAAARDSVTKLSADSTASH